MKRLLCHALIIDEGSRRTCQILEEELAVGMDNFYVMWRDGWVCDHQMIVARAADGERLIRNPGGLLTLVCKMNFQHCVVPGRKAAGELDLGSTA